LFDYYGNLAKEDKSKGETLYWELSSLRKNIYVVNIYDASGKTIKTEKFIIK